MFQDMLAMSNNGDDGGLKAFYVYGMSSTNTVYSYYSSLTDTLNTIPYALDPGTVLIDDENITLTKGSGHNATITFKKDGYYVKSSSSTGQQFTSEAKTAGTTVSESDIYLCAPLIMYFK